MTGESCPGRQGRTEKGQLAAWGSLWSLHGAGHTPDSAVSPAAVSLDGRMAGGGT